MIIVTSLSQCLLNIKKAHRAKTKQQKKNCFFQALKIALFSDPQQKQEQPSDENTEDESEQSQLDDTMTDGDDDVFPEEFPE